jgi:hypothetical protein
MKRVVQNIWTSTFGDSSHFIKTLKITLFINIS